MKQPILVTLMLIVYAVLIASALIAVSILLTQRRIFHDTVSVLALSVGAIGLSAMIVADIGRDQPRMMRLTFVFLTLAAAMFGTSVLFDFWNRWDVVRFCRQYGTILSVLSLILVHRMVLAPLLVQRPSLMEIVFKRTALISAPLCVACLALPFLRFRLDTTGEVLIRLTEIFLVISVSSTLGVGAATIFRRSFTDDDTGVLDTRAIVDLVCPRCSNPIRAGSGGTTRCGSCRLKVSVRVEEPRCDCGYLLYQLTSDACPECGDPIDPIDRWSPD